MKHGDVGVPGLHFRWQLLLQQQKYAGCFPPLFQVSDGYCHHTKLIKEKGGPGKKWLLKLLIELWPKLSSFIFLTYICSFSLFSLISAILKHYRKTGKGYPQPVSLWIVHLTIFSGGLTSRFLHIHMMLLQSNRAEESLKITGSPGVFSCLIQVPLWPLHSLKLLQLVFGKRSNLYIGFLVGMPVLPPSAISWSMGE